MIDNQNNGVNEGQLNQTSLSDQGNSNPKSSEVNQFSQNGFKAESHSYPSSNIENVSKTINENQQPTNTFTNKISTTGNVNTNIQFDNYPKNVNTNPKQVNTNQTHQSNQSNQINTNVNLDYDLNRNVTATSMDFKKDTSEPTHQTYSNRNNNLHASMLAPDFKIDTKLSKKLDFKLPVKYKGIDYFRLCDVIKKQLDSGQREMNSNKTEKALIHCELAYYYLINIDK